jgi:NUMOD3 motif.
MHYTVYKVTHRASGRYYIGVHQTEDLDDGYLGSGLHVTRAVEKYGREAFEKEILFNYDNPDEMFSKEKELVTLQVVEDPETFNLCPGGRCGSWWRANQVTTSEQRREAAMRGNRKKRELLKDPNWAPKFREAARRNIQEWNKRAPPEAYATFTGRKHSEETKAKMRASMGQKQTGKNNSQFGTCWVCREGEAPRKIKKTELLTFQEAGWQRGRKVRPAHSG